MIKIKIKLTPCEITYPVKASKRMCHTLDLISSLHARLMREVAGRQYWLHSIMQYVERIVGVVQFGCFVHLVNQHCVEVTSVSASLMLEAIVCVYTLTKRNECFQCVGPSMLPDI